MNTEGIVRVGNTVRRPVGPWTATVHGFLRHLEAEGFEAAPRVLGFDEAGREILTYMPGSPPERGDLARDLDLLHRAARLVGELHTISASFRPPPDARWRPPAFDPGGGTLTLHGDLGPWNVLVHEGRIAIVDWDDAAPGRAEWEIGYSLLTFADLWPDADLADGEAVDRIKCFADGYRMTTPQLHLALDLVPQRCRWMSEGIVAMAEQGHAPAVRMREAGTHLAWATTADGWDRRLPIWQQLASTTHH